MKIKQQIYESRSATRRLDGLRMVMKQRHINLYQLAERIGIAAESTSNIVYRAFCPSLPVYLRLADFFEWDISRDVNYAYHCKQYPPEEICRRLFRLHPGLPTRQKLSLMLVDELSYSYGMIAATLYGYTHHATPKAYGAVMHYIQREEQEMHYPDALNFEP